MLPRNDIFLVYIHIVSCTSCVLFLFRKGVESRFLISGFNSSFDKPNNIPRRRWDRAGTYVPIAASCHRLKKCTNHHSLFEHDTVHTNKLSKQKKEKSFLSQAIPFHRIPSNPTTSLPKHYFYIFTTYVNKMNFIQNRSFFMLFFFVFFIEYICDVKHPILMVYDGECIAESRAISLIPCRI